ncbi:MAG: hypothetical protein ACW99L_00825 [Promethearchaeota archaeon]|jgi:hypothetical protein
MKNTKKILSISGILVLIQLLFISSIPVVKAESKIPSNFNQNLDLEKTYIYNVTAFNITKPLEWADVDWLAPTKGFVAITPGGQLKVRFTGFYENDPNDFFNIFRTPMPYMDIEFIENVLGNLITNTSIINVSNGEAAQNLLLGYNKFKSGFLIPISSYGNLTQQANDQDEPPFMNATVSIQETTSTISFEFKQKTFLQQKTMCIYDKISGLLTYTNTSFGNYTLEMTLINLPSFPSESQSIPSFQISTIFGVIMIATLISIIKTKKKKKNYKNLN